MDITTLNLTSSNVFVYPSAKRANQDDIYKSSRLVGEESFTRQHNIITTIPSYVISDDFVVGQSFKFVIEGYYFDVIITTEDLSKFNNNLYAKIKLEGEENFHELTGLDIDGKFMGLTLTDEKTELCILQKIDNEWIIPETSKVKFYFKDILIQDIDVIDCGVVSI